jgi:hypothetical protein
LLSRVKNGVGVGIIKTAAVVTLVVPRNGAATSAISGPPCH